MVRARFRAEKPFPTKELKALELDLDPSLCITIPARSHAKHRTKRLINDRIRSHAHTVQKLTDTWGIRKNLVDSRPHKKVSGLNRVTRTERLRGRPGGVQPQNAEFPIDRRQDDSPLADRPDQGRLPHLAANAGIHRPEDRYRLIRMHNWKRELRYAPMNSQLSVPLHAYDMDAGSCGIRKCPVPCANSLV